MGGHGRRNQWEAPRRRARPIGSGARRPAGRAAPHAVLGFHVGGGHGGERRRVGPEGSRGCSEPSRTEPCCAVFSPQGSPEAAEEAEQGPEPPAEGTVRRGKRAVPTAAAPQPAKLSRAELYKPPTSEELTQLKETEDLFHSSLLRLQVRRGVGRVAGGCGTPDLEMTWVIELC